MQVKKDAECHVAMEETVGQEDTINDTDLDTAKGPTIESDSKWCCLYCVISLQDYFVNFYLKFHCEFNSIEMLWRYAKYHEFLNIL